MGASLGRMRRSASAPDDYERVLADVLRRLTALQAAHAAALRAERRAATAVVLYGAAGYALALAYVFLFPRAEPPTAGAAALRVLRDGAAVLGLPVAVWAAGRGVRAAYARRLAALQRRIDDCRRLQRDTIEELKQRTAYDRTRGLIERYGGGDGKAPAPVANAAPAPSLSHATQYPISHTRNARPAQAPTSVSQAAPSPQFTNSSTAVPPRPAVSAVASQTGAQHIHPFPPPATRTAQPRSWMDRLVDALVGEECAAQRYALVCARCHTHNGLARPEAFAALVFRCMACGQTNGPAGALSPASPLSPTYSISGLASLGHTGASAPSSSNLTHPSGALGSDLTQPSGALSANTTPLSDELSDKLGSNPTQPSDELSQSASPVDISPASLSSRDAAPSTRPQDISEATTGRGSAAPPSDIASAARAQSPQRKSPPRHARAAPESQVTPRVSARRRRQ